MLEHVKSILYILFSPKNEAGLEIYVDNWTKGVRGVMCE